MKREQLVHSIKSIGKAVFTIADLKKLFPDEKYIGISIKRLLDKHDVLQVARGIYTLNQEGIDVEIIATQYYYPSYISFESGLSKYGIINQGLYGLTLATTRHSKRITYAGVDCAYSQLHPKLFFGYRLINKTYLAYPEKAFLDQLYLISLGKRNNDPSEWDISQLDKGAVKEFAASYSTSVRQRIAQMGF